MPVTFFSGGSPGLDPTSIASLTLWYEASVGIFQDEAATNPVTADGQSVQAWVDAKNSFKVIRNGAGTEPTYKTAIFNGRPVLRFDASDDQLLNTGGTADDYIASTGTTIFSVAKYSDATPANDQYQILFYNATGARYCMGIHNLAGGQTAYGLNDDGGYDNAALTGAMNTLTIYSRFHNGSNVYLGRNDTRTASMNAVASGNATIGANTGLYLRNFPGGPAGIDIAELIVFNTALSEDDRKGIETRLAWKYGVTLPY